MALQKRTKLTNSSDETEIALLISGDSIFSIPYFQRAYKWKKERLDQLNEDILGIVDQSSDFHFLGAIIIHGRPNNPSDPKPFEVIDGQQRITTLYLYIAAIVKFLCSKDQYAEAASYFLKYLVIGREINLISNLKLHPCKDDRNQLNRVFKEILSDGNFVTKLGAFKPKLFPPGGKDSGILWNNYKYALRFLNSQHEQGQLERIQRISQALLENMSVVQIDVWDPTNGPKIFDSLNSRQEPMTIGDLIRNEIFARVASEPPATIEQIDQNHWQPFYRKFQQDSKNLFDAYFFPYGLIQNPNLRKSEVYNMLREEWRQINDPIEIIRSLSRYQDAFIDIECGSNRQNHNPDLAAIFRKLFEMDIPSTTYPFIMKISYEVKEGRLNEKDAIETLEVVESFLIRRAICGHEPTGLHAVFKRLWIDCGEHPTKDTAMLKIKEHKTVVWPDNNNFQNALKNRPLYGANVTKYLLLEYDRSLGGDQPDNTYWIEHILPDFPHKDWYNIFSKEEHQQYKNTLANLIPLSQHMNQELSNRLFGEKREKYLVDSMFKSARKVACDYQNWTPIEILHRAELLSDWALKRWPH